jgi:hypothetical protein
VIPGIFFLQTALNVRVYLVVRIQSPPGKWQNLLSLWPFLLVWASMGSYVGANLWRFTWLNGCWKTNELRVRIFTYHGYKLGHQRESLSCIHSDSLTSRFPAAKSELSHLEDLRALPLESC